MYNMTHIQSSSPCLQYNLTHILHTAPWTYYYNITHILSSSLYCYLRHWEFIWWHQPAPASCSFNSPLVLKFQVTAKLILSLNRLFSHITTLKFVWIKQLWNGQQISYLQLTVSSVGSSLLHFNNWGNSSFVSQYSSEFMTLFSLEHYLYCICLHLYLWQLVW